VSRADRLPAVYAGANANASPGPRSALTATGSGFDEAGGTGSVAAPEHPGADGAAAAEPDFLSTSAAGPAAVRGGTIRVTGFLAGALVSIVAAALLFRHLGTVTTGRYVYALTLVAIVGAMSDLGLTAVGVREMAGLAAEERWPIARDLLGLRITLTAVGAVVVTALAWATYGPALAFGVVLASFGLLLQATQDNFALPLLLGLRLGWLTVLDFSRTLLTTLITITLVLLGASLVPFLAISIPVGVVMLVATAMLVRRTRALRPTFSLHRWRAFIGKVLPYTFAVAASVLYFRLAILLVSALSNGRQLGYFAASFRVIEVLTMVPGLLIGAAFPIFARAAREDHERFGYALGRVFDVSVIVGAWIAVSIAVGAPLAIHVIGGHKFAAAIPVLAVQGIGLGAMFVSLVWANALLSLGVYRLILVLSIGTLLANAVLLGVLVPLDGARGAAFATAAAEIVAIIVQAAAVVRGRPALRPSLRVVPFVALAAGAGLTPLLMTGVPVIVRVFISTVLFSVIVLASGTVPREMLDLMPPVVGRTRARLRGGT
jgi:O-antigen/teichoic acid export membrane protein